MPTKECKASDLGAETTFDALLDYTFANTSFSAEDRNQYKATFKYRLEEKHESRWVNFEDTEGFGYAIASNESKGYVFISATIMKKGAVAPTSLVTSLLSTANASTAKPKVVKKGTKSKHKTPSRSISDGTKSVEQKILSAMKELLEIKISTPPRKQVALFSGYSNTASKGFANALSKLSKTHGFIEYPDKKTVRLTGAGIAAAGAVSPPTSNVEVQERIRDLLKPKEIEIFNILCDGNAHLRRDVATATNYTNVASKGFANALSKLSTLDILEYPKHPTDSKIKLVQLTDLAFPFGRFGFGNNRGSADMTVFSEEPIDVDALVSDLDSV